MKFYFDPDDKAYMLSEVSFKGVRWQLTAYNQGTAPRWIHPGMKGRAFRERLEMFKLAPEATSVSFREREARITDQKYVDALMELEMLKVAVLGFDPILLYRVELSESPEIDSPSFVPKYILNRSLIPKVEVSLPSVIQAKVDEELRAIIELGLPQEKAGEPISKSYFMPQAEVDQASGRVRIVRSTGSYTDAEIFEIAQSQILGIIPVDYLIRAIGDLQMMILHASPRI